MDQIFLYDTTLRDGQQTQGVQFTYEDKFRIVNALDNLGLDYIEGGWPGANPTDTDFFQIIDQSGERRDIEFGHLFEVANAPCRKLATALDG